MSELVFREGFWVRADHVEQDLVIVRDIVQGDAYRTALLGADAFNKVLHVAVPAGIGDAPWCLVKLAALLRQEGAVAAVADAEATSLPRTRDFKVIRSMPWKSAPSVCIDDAYLFREATWQERGPNLDPALFTRAHWPTLAEIEALLPGYELWEENYIRFGVLAD